MTCVPCLRAIAEPHILNRIDRCLDELWSLHPGVPSTVRCRLRIANNEIVVNIVKHATKGIDRPVGIQMWVMVRDNDVVVTFEDDGIVAADGVIDREMPHELDESGRGIPLARATLSHLEYRRSHERNFWILVSEPF